MLKAALAGLLASTLIVGASAALAQSEQPLDDGEARGAALQDGVEVRRGPLIMKVTALADGIIRVRIGRDGKLPEDASWAVPAEVRRLRARVQPQPNGFSTALLRVTLDPASLRLSVSDLQGRIISADAADPVRLDGRGFTLRKALPQQEHIFGLGDKTRGLDRREQAFVDWNTDSYGFSSSTDPIYKSIPFFIGVGGEGGSYGLFLDNSWRTWFDFGHREPGEIQFGGTDGPIDYYLIAGPSTAEVVRRYTDLTGKAPLAPVWALGYQQSRYSYMSADEVREIAARLRSDRVPTDVIWLDIDYQDRNRPFTVNSKTFPDLAGLAKDMRREGINLVAITDLHVAMAPNQNYAPYDSGTAANAFVHNPDGSVYVAPVWPGPSVFPDFTAASSRRWWGGLYQDFLGAGIAGFWNDMNEPAIFETPTKTMPLDTVHRIDSDDFAPRNASHREIHNVYGMQNTRATYEGLRSLRPDQRAFVMTRASYAGGQRYAVTWTGDNSSTWDHLKLSVQQLINLGLSGFSYSAADVGGFTGGPSADLLTRWFEIAAFTPVFRDHSAKLTPRAEPWVDGPEHLAIRRRFVEERYRLLPYLYALADLNSRTGDPIMRPVFYDYPQALSASCDQSIAFTLGSSLLIAPPPHPESPQRYDVCLPKGGWYDYWTGLPATPVPGAATPAPAAGAPSDPVSDMISETPKLDRLAVFVRAGTVLPRQPVVQSTSETPKGPLSLDVFPGPDCKGMLYADDGRSMAFQRGVYLRQEIRCTSGPDGIRLTFDRRKGSFKPWWRELAVTVHGWSGSGRVALRGEAIEATSDGQARTLAFRIPDMAKGGEIRIGR